MPRITSVIFLALISTALPLHAALIQGCDGGLQTRTEITLQLDGDPMNASSFGGLSCVATSVNSVKTNGDNAGAAIAAAGFGAAAGVGMSVLEDSNAVILTANASVEYEFILEKTAPFANDVVSLTYYGELATPNADFYGQLPLIVQYQVRRGTVEIFEELNGFRSTPKNDDRNFDASLAPGAVTPFSGEVDIVAGRLSSIRLSVTLRMRGLVTRDFEGTLGMLFAGFSLAISGGILSVPDGYALNYLSGVTPQAGIYPQFDAPLSLIPLPASCGLFAGAALMLGRIRTRRTPKT